MTEIDVVKLRSLAESATPGQWAWTGEPGDDEACLDAVGADGYVLSAHGMHTEGFVNVEASDAEFIAAANPATVLALLDRLEQAEAHAFNVKRLAGRASERIELLARAERAEAAIERVRALHASEGWRLPGGGESREYCTRCDCRWPCPTVAALDTGKEKNE